MKYNFALHKPILTSDHFLPSSPIIFLGRDIKIGSEKIIENRYALLHEYGHYEDYISWPLTSIQMLKNISKNIEVINTYKKTKDLNALSKLKFNEQYFPFESKITIHGDNIFSILDNKIGYDIILESSAILNHIKRPLNNLNRYSTMLADKLYQEKLQPWNKIHSVAVRLTHDAVRGIMKEVGINDDAYHNFLISDLNKIIARVSFGYVITQMGYNIKDKNYQNLNMFIINNISNIECQYKDLTQKLYSDVLIYKKYDEIIKLLFNFGQPLMDFSVFAYHCYLSVIHSLYYIRIKEYFPDDKELESLFMTPILNILKMYEALFYKILREYNIPKLKPYRTPVPIILYNEQKFSLVQLEMMNDNSGFQFIWGINNNEDKYSAYSWLQMLFINKLTNSFTEGKNNCICPIFEKINKFHDKDTMKRDNFLNKFCNSSMNYNLDMVSNVHNCSPSEEYCLNKFDNKDENKDENKNCFFHNSINYILHDK